MSCIGNLRGGDDFRILLMVKRVKKMDFFINNVQGYMCKVMLVLYYEMYGQQGIDDFKLNV